MIRFCPLCSGSSGNSTYIGTEKEGILIDAGRSCKYLVQSLTAVGIEPQAVRAVLVTHDHQDHISALRVLGKKLKCPIYATPETLEGILLSGMEGAESFLEELPKHLSVAEMEVHSFDTPHDASHSVGFRIDTGSRKIGFATDLGNVTKEVWKGLEGCDLVLLEANYDEAMLRLSSYPYELKRRIRSAHGHLSNPDSADCICRLAETGTARFYLGHLSQENNMPAIARQTVELALEARGMKAGRDYELEVAKRLEPSSPTLF